MTPWLAQQLGIHDSELVAFYPLQDNFLDYSRFANKLFVQQKSTVLHGNATLRSKVGRHGFWFDTNQSSLLQASGAAPPTGVTDFSISDRFSLSCWFCPGHTLSQPALISKFVASGAVGSYTGYDLEVGSSNLRFYLINGSQNSQSKSVQYGLPNSVNFQLENHWMHVGCSYDGSNSVAGMKLYVNGRLVPSTTLNNNTIPVDITNSGVLTLGIFPTTNSVSDDMLMSLVRVYRQDISPAKFRQIYEVERKLDYFHPRRVRSPIAAFTIIQSSGTSLFTESATTSSGNFTLFSDSATKASGIVTLFIGSGNAINNNTTLYTSASTPASGNIKLFMDSSVPATGSVKLYTANIGLASGVRTLFVGSSLPASGKFTLFTESANSASSGITLYTQVPGMVSSSPSLFIGAKTSVSGHFNLYTQAHVNWVKKNLFVGARALTVFSTKLFIASANVPTSGSIFLVEHGKVPSTGRIPLFIKPTFAPISGKFTLFEKVSVVGSGQGKMNLTINPTGNIIVLSSLRRRAADAPLTRSNLPGTGVNGSMNMFVGGLPSPTSSVRTLFAFGKNTADNASGIVPLFIDSSLSQTKSTALFERGSNPMSSGIPLVMVSASKASGVSLVIPSILGSGFAQTRFVVDGGGF